MQNLAIQVTPSIGMIKSVDFNGPKTVADKVMLSNGMEIFDFNEEAIISKMESMMLMLDRIL